MTTTRFEWFVNDNGYKLGTAAGGCFAGHTVVYDSDSVVDPKRLYHPDDFPALFRIFADTPPDGEGVRSFANRFGLLGGQVTQLSPVKEAPVKVPNAPHPSDFKFPVEFVSDWAREIRAMRLAVEIWDAMQGGDSERAWKLVNEHANHYMFSEEPRTSDFYASFSLAHAPPEHSPLGLLDKICNTQLRGVSPRLARAKERTGLAMVLQPDSLLSAMWLQFAEAAVGGKEFANCETCGTWFQFRRVSDRATRKYCSNACRVRAYRNRKEKNA